MKDVMSGRVYNQKEFEEIHANSKKQWRCSNCKGVKDNT